MSTRTLLPAVFRPFLFVLLAAPAAATQLTAASAAKAIAVSGPVVAATPSAASLLRKSYGAMLGQGSVDEYGYISSSNNSVLDGEHFWFQFSWRKQLFRDHEAFSGPTNLGSIKNVRDVKRVVVGSKLAVWAHKKWKCATSTVNQNAAYWAVPHYNLSSPTTVGQTTLHGFTVWHVRGTFKQGSGGTYARYTVDVYVDSSSYVFRGATDIGVAHRKGVGTAQITGKVTYGAYGKPVKVRLPLACQG